MKNPLSEDYTVMRTTMVPSVMQVISSNYAKKNKDVRLFEISRIYIDREHKIEQNELPTEDTVLAMAAYGENMDFYAMKGYIENLLDLVNVKGYTFSKENRSKCYHPGRTAKISIGKEVIAILGEVHPIVSENYNVQERVYLAQIDICLLYTSFYKTIQKLLK